MESYLRVNLLGPGPRLIKKEFTRPRSHKGWETHVERTCFCILKDNGVNLIIHLHSDNSHSLGKGPGLSLVCFVFHLILDEMCIALKTTVKTNTEFQIVIIWYCWIDGVDKIWSMSHLIWHSHCLFSST